MTTEQGHLLPVCEALSVGNESSVMIVDNNSEPLRCHYQFKEFCGVCLPLCASFSQYTDQVKIGERTILVIAAILSIIGGVVVIIASVIRKKKM